MKQLPVKKELSLEYCRAKNIAKCCKVEKGEYDRHDILCSNKI